MQQSDASFEIRARYLVLIKRLSDYFSRSTIKDHTATLWLDALEGAAIEIPHLQQAVDLLAAKSKFMPSLADLISTCDAMLAQECARTQQERDRIDRDRARQAVAYPDHPSRLTAIAAVKRLKLRSLPTKDALVCRYLDRHPDASDSDLIEIFGHSSLFTRDRWNQSEIRYDPPPPCPCSDCARDRDETVHGSRPAKTHGPRTVRTAG